MYIRVHFICGFITIAILMIVKEFREPFNVMRLNNFTEFYLTCFPLLHKVLTLLPTDAEITHLPRTHTYSTCLPLPFSSRRLLHWRSSSFYLFRLTLCVNWYEICAFLLQFYFICFSFFSLGIFLPLLSFLVFFALLLRLALIMKMVLHKCLRRYKKLAKNWK